MSYTEYVIHLKPSDEISSEDISAIVIADLSDFEFESFVEENEIVKAYIQSEKINNEIDEFLSKHHIVSSYNAVKMKDENWNAIWESSFQPVEINKDVRIRASFHEPDNRYPYEILIHPKMSFGTGHHATTQLMMEEMLELDLNQSELLDMGCGTGILAILAEKRGASSIDAVDNDPQCIINSLENVELNNCKNIRVQLFSEFIPQKKYLCILANIQRNVLLDQMEMYANISQQGTYLLLSGIIPEDIEIIGNKAKEFNFNVLKEKTKGTWALLLLKKS